MGVLGIAVIGVTGCLAALFFTQDKKEYAIMITLGIGILISIAIVSRLEVIMSALTEITDTIHVENTVFRTLLKMIGITYIAEFSAAICKDAGFQAVSVQIEMFSKIVILAMSAPLLVTLLQSLGGLLA